MLAPADSPVHQELCKAASEGQYRRVEILYGSEGANIDTRDRMEITALHHATIRGDHEMMEFLLGSGADVNSRHTLLGIPICAAALRGHSKAVEVLIKYKAGLRLTHNGAIGSAMHCACFSGDMAILKMLLERGGDLKQSSTISMLAFYDMAKEDFVPDWSPFWSRKYGVRQIKCTSVLLAAERCHFDLLDLCWIELGKTRPESIPITSMYSLDNPRWGFVAEKDVKGRYSPSIGTTVSTEASTFSTWSSFGFPRTASAKVRSTLLMWAAASLNIDLITYLMDHGARVDAQDAFQRTALHYAALPFEEAAFQNINRCVEKLVQWDISHRTLSQLLPLIVTPDHPTLDPRVTRSHGDDLQVRYINSILSNVNRTFVPDAVYKALCVVLQHESYSRSVFEALCNHPSCLSPNHLLRDIVRMFDPSEIVISSLLNYGADPNFLLMERNPSDDTALDVAVKTRKSKAIAAILLKHGASPDVVSGDGETPRTRAKELHRDYMTELFDASLAGQANRPWFPIQLALPSLPFGQKRKPP
jgi:ankyrin repeat protein